MTPTPEQIEAEAALRRVWNEAIERCAQELEKCESVNINVEYAASLLRALKDKP